MSETVLDFARSWATNRGWELATSATVAPGFVVVDKGTITVHPDAGTLELGEIGVTPIPYAAVLRKQRG